MKIHAYVSNECCAMTKAFEPGAEYQGVRVSKHGDLSPWTRGKRETLQILEHSERPDVSAYSVRCARAVARMKGWGEG